MNKFSLIFGQQRNRPKRWVTLVVGVALLGQLLSALATETNAPAKWIPVAELLKKWGDTPIEEVQRVADGGDLTAQHYLGYCYSEGFRAATNGSTALKWYQRAGDGGYLASYHNIGRMYDRGLVVPWDMDAAIAFYKRAAEQGFAGSQVRLGFIYYDGIGVRGNAAEADKWFRLAADQGNVDAMLGLVRMNELPIPELVDGKSQIPPHSRLESVRWLRAAADLGSAEGQVRLGRFYLAGDVIPGDEEKALDLVRRSADQEFAEGLYWLGVMYAGGIGEPRNDSERPFKLFLRAASSNFTPACSPLAARYETGTGTEREMVEAAAWRLRGLKLQIDDSLENGGLGAVHDQLVARALGKVVPDDPYSRIIALFSKAARDNDPDAFKQISHLYEEGKNVPKDPQRAKFWFALAAHDTNAMADFPAAWLEQWNRSSAAAREVIAALR